ncbi:MAG: hypothetical protein PHX78_02415 [bacterium]|nr:hypothetical protein [bacterium]
MKKSVNIMKRKFIKKFLLMILSSFVFTGCTSSGKDDFITGSTSPESEVNQILEADDFFISEITDVLTKNEDPMPRELNNGLSLLPGLIFDPTLPVAKYPAVWWRQRTGTVSVNKDYQFDSSGDTATCTVTIIRSVTGILHVDTSLANSLNPGNKNFADTITFKFYLEKAPNSGWQLKKISPRQMKLTDNSQQKVSIEWIKVIKGGITVLEITSSGQMLTIDDLPFFKNTDKVTVQVKVANTSPRYNPSCLVFLHRFIGASQINRLRMHDDGKNGGDEIAYDDIFTGTWYVKGPYRQLAVIDVLDSKCLQNQTEDDYNSIAWGVPYRIIH